MITFPSKRYLMAVYGFSALSILGNRFLFSFSIKFLIVPVPMIPSILIFLINLSTLSTKFLLAIDLIYIKAALVLVYLPNIYFFIHRSLLLILLLISPMFASMFSVKASNGPRDVFSVTGVDILLDKSLLVSRAIYLFFDSKSIVNPLFK